MYISCLKELGVIWNLLPCTRRILEAKKKGDHFFTVLFNAELQVPDYSDLVSLR